MLSTHASDHQEEVENDRMMAEGLAEMHASPELTANFDINKVTSFYQLLKITSVDQRPAFLINMTDSDSFRNLLKDNDVLMHLLKYYLPPHMVEGALVKIGRVKLQSLIGSRHNLIELLQLLPLELRRGLLNFIGTDFVKNIIAKKDDEFESYLGILLSELKSDKPLVVADPNSVALTYLRNELGIDYVKSVADSTDKFDKILKGLAESDKVPFLKWLGLDFIISNMKNKEEIYLFLMFLNKPRDRFEFLINIDVRDQKDIYHNSEKLIKVLMSLYTHDRFTYVKHLNRDVISKICTDKNIVNEVSKCFFPEDRIVFLQHSGYANELLPKVTEISQDNHSSASSRPTISSEQLALPSSSASSSYSSYEDFEDEDEIGRDAAFLALEEVFDKVIANLPVDNHNNKYITSFNTNIMLVRDHALNNSYDFMNVMSIAQSCRALVEKVSSRTVTKNDCNRFLEETRAYQTNKFFDVLITAIISAVSGMILGASIGLAGGFFGVAIGAGIGFFAGGVSAAAFELRTKNREDLLVHLSIDARKLIA